MVGPGVLEVGAVGVEDELQVVASAVCVILVPGPSCSVAFVY
jgi:hypothetical protein